MKESSSKKQSAGLGLTISQNLCLALGSIIKCKSEVTDGSSGSIFYFDIKHCLESVPE